MIEQELLSRAQSGDREALARLLHGAYPILYGYLQKLTLDGYRAEDLTQKTMLRAMERLNQFRGGSKFSTWLIKIATNLYRDELRAEERHPLCFERTYASAAGADFAQILLRSILCPAGRTSGSAGGNNKIKASQCTQAAEETFGRRRMG